MRHFSRRYRCIAYNARGYPPSDVPEDFERYSQARARDDIRCVLDALGMQRAHVVGLSMGAFATLHFGMTYGHRALSHHRGGRRLRLAPGAVPQFQADSKKNAELIKRKGMAHFVDDLRRRSAARAARDQGSARLRRVPAPVQGAFGPRRDEHPARRSVPPSVVLRPDRRDGAHGRADADHVGRRGGALPRSQSADEAHHPERRRSRSCRAAGTRINLEEPALFNQLLEDFFRQVETGRWSQRDKRSTVPSIYGPGRQALTRPSWSSRSAAPWAGSCSTSPRKRNAINDAMWRGIPPAMKQLRRRPGGALRGVPRRRHRGVLGGRGHLRVRQEPRRRPRRWRNTTACSTRCCTPSRARSSPRWR